MRVTRKTVTIAVYFVHCLLLSQTSPLDDPDVGLNTVQMIKNHGYPCRSHYIRTEDGYILTYHQIDHGKKQRNPTRKSPVLLMHALSLSSADFVNMGPNRSLAYILADEGYDVWIGNSRGNLWGRNHTKLDVVTDSEEFFNFSWHEVGYYDLPAAIDYILKVTNDKKLFYVGYSMGSTAFLVLASTRPEYNEKIRLASLMAPVAFMGNLSNQFVVGLSSIMHELETLAREFGVYEIPFVDQIHQIGITFCSRPEFFVFCEIAIFLFVGADPVQLPQNKIAVFLTNAPSYSSLKQWAHYAQLINNGEFSQYDHGQKGNVKIYGNEKPPVYNLSKILAPLAIYYGKNDGLLDIKNVQKLAKKLPNVVHFYMVPYNNFNHLDFIWAKDVVQLLYSEMLKVKKRY